MERSRTSIFRQRSLHHEIEKLNLHTTQVMTYVQPVHLFQPHPQRPEQFSSLALPKLVESVLENIFSAHTEQEIDLLDVGQPGRLWNSQRSVIDELLTESDNGHCRRVYSTGEDVSSCSLNDLPQAETRIEEGYARHPQKVGNAKVPPYHSLVEEKVKFKNVFSLGRGCALVRQEGSDRVDIFQM